MKKKYVEYKVTVKSLYVTYLYLSQTNRIMLWSFCVKWIEVKGACFLFIFWNIFQIIHSRCLPIAKVWVIPHLSGGSVLIISFCFVCLIYVCFLCIMFSGLFFLFFVYFVFWIVLFVFCVLCFLDCSFCFLCVFCFLDCSFCFLFSGLFFLLCMSSFCILFPILRVFLDYPFCFL